MNYIKKLLIVVAFIAFGCQSNDQSDLIVNSFFKKYEHENINSAIDYLFSTNKWMKESEEEVEKIKKGLNDFTIRMGKYYGYELVSCKNLNDNLKQYTFQLRYDLQPLRFKIFFYKPNDEWRVQNFEYDSEWAIAE